MDQWAEEGLEASTNAVARRAGVGIATVFRRFPSRDDLIGAVFEDKMASYTAAVEAALADPDPWLGFCGYVEQGVPDAGRRLRVRGRADPDVPERESLEKERNRVLAALKELIKKAKATGRLRQDFVHQGIAMILMADAGVVTATEQDAPGTWCRRVGFLLQSFTAEVARPLAAHPDEAMCRAMRRP
ncbi:TetR/AcrR family transcriptional regulator [Streptomyces sp. NPDC127038]|uniref:TetR/AcrR family transcriptional regulator n=1 Tax=Streptomyces sp. NPDC127038 TaxID=3347114 RepID=UPI003647DDB2